MSVLNTLNSIRIHKALTKIMKNSQYGSMKFNQIILKEKWFKKLDSDRICNMKFTVSKIHETIEKDPLRWISLPIVNYPSGSIDNSCSAEIEVNNKKILFFASFTMLHIHIDPYLTGLSKNVMYLSIDFLNDAIKCSLIDNKFSYLSDDLVSELKKFNLIK